jgi:hypothetical protein
MVLNLQKFLAHREDQRRLNSIDFGELGKDTHRHKVKLFGICVPRVLAGFVVGRMR